MSKIRRMLMSRNNIEVWTANFTIKYEDSSKYNKIYTDTDYGIGFQISLYNMQFDLDSTIVLGSRKIDNPVKAEVIIISRESGEQIFTYEKELTEKRKAFINVAIINSNNISNIDNSEDSSSSVLGSYTCINYLSYMPLPSGLYDVFVKLSSKRIWSSDEETDLTVNGACIADYSREVGDLKNSNKVTTKCLYSINKLSPEGSTTVRGFFNRMGYWGTEQ